MILPIPKQNAVKPWSPSGKYYCITNQNQGMSKMLTMQNVKSATFPPVRLTMPLLSPLLFLLHNGIISIHVSCGMKFIFLSVIRLKQGGGEAGGRVNLFPVSLSPQWKGWDTATAAAAVVPISQQHMGLEQQHQQQQTDSRRCCCANAAVALLLSRLRYLSEWNGAGSQRRPTLQRYSIVCDSSVSCAGAVNDCGMTKTDIWKM